MILGPTGAWISEGEYRQNFPDRAMMGELAPGYSYEISSLLHRNIHGLEAHRRPIRMQNVQQMGGFALISFIVETPKISTPDGTPPPEDFICKGTVNENGLLYSEQYNIRSVRIKQMYLSFDLSISDDDLSQLSTSLYVPA
ncbi:MAG TPA: hypothetical protein PKD15_04675 [Candidatus Saccharibacteria bacterium]|nr:hypothetical protein [Candidatus Saccharibacteria bacterium]